MAEEVDFFAPDDAESGTPEFVKDRVTKLVREFQDLKNLIEDQERALAELNSKKFELEMRKIPDALLEAGLSELVTLEGLRVSTQLFVGTIAADKKPEAYAWMDANGFGSVIKRQVSVQFDKGSTEAAKQAEEAIRQLGLEPKSTLDVHAQTFKAFAKEQTLKGVTIPFEQWGVYYGHKAVIK